MPERTQPRHRRDSARTLLATRVRQALGFRGAPIERGETATRVTVWSIRELQDVYARTGGTTTLTHVTRTLSEGTTFDITEVTVTTRIPGLATVEITTDWDPTDELYGYTLPVIRDYTTAGARRG